ncbi:MAG: YtxH domain-containing protein [Bacteroidales bacterium]|nr:YtxH domain-containing protein [Bacteroidales bacterium]
MKTSHLFTFLSGALIGVIIALLLAPESGDETRKKINEKLKERGINLSREQLDEFIKSFKEKFNIKSDQELLVDEQTSTEPEE